MKNAIVVLLASTWSVMSVQADSGFKNVTPAKPIIDDGTERTSPSSHGLYIPGLDKAMFLNWVAVDSMVNAFGPANPTVKPIVYDPPTHTLALIHRGALPYAVSGGQLWYNVSQNEGLNWRRAGELNGSAPNSARYPTCTIMNPANNADTGQCLFVYAAIALDDLSGQTCMLYGVDYPLGGGAGSGILDCFGAVTLIGLSIWPQSYFSSVFWTTQASWITQASNHMLWRASAYDTMIVARTPPSWVIAPPNFIYSIGPVGGMGRATASYYSTQGLFYPDSTARAFNAGYSKSTNNGVTWSGWYRPSPDWMAATGLPPHYDLYDYRQPPGETVFYLSDMLIDANERAHFFHVVVDSPWTNLDQRGILEVYETNTGWAYKWVTQNLNPRTALAYPGSSGTLNWTGNAIHASTTSDGQVMAIVWLDAGTQSATDTLPDIWFSMRTVGSSSWTTPINLTQTPGFAELLLHAAPVMRRTSGSVTIFLGRSYQCNINTYPPDNGMKTTFYAASFTTPIVNVDESAKPSEFRLEQNYPNPFNPRTDIGFRIVDFGFVSLRVYDLLGREVAPLVNEVRQPGKYEVTWTPHNVGSGVYFYRLQAGTFSQTKKLLLLR